MAWQVEFTPKAKRALDRLDQQVIRRILRFLSERLAAAKEPRALGEALRATTPGTSGSIASGTTESLPTLRI
jgi:mRNA interferase RelE/StbE